MQLYTNGEDESPPVGISRSQSVETTDDTCHEDAEHYDFNFCRNETSHNDDGSGRLRGKFSSCPVPLTMQYWAEPDSNSFLVRGANYKTDRLKQNAGRSIGRLVAVDVVTVDEPLYSGFSLHPTERIQQGLNRERNAPKGNEVDLPPFVFVVNIVLPGPRTFVSVVWSYLLTMCLKLGITWCITSLSMIGKPSMVVTILLRPSSARNFSLEIATSFGTLRSS